MLRQAMPRSGREVFVALVHRPGDARVDFDGEGP
jgi:hypothetical protein